MTKQPKYTRNELKGLIQQFVQALRLEMEKQAFNRDRRARFLPKAIRFTDEVIEEHELVRRMLDDMNMN